MRVLQVMAGSPNGGAEAFFERLCIALHARGLTQRAIIRRDAARVERLRRASVDVVEMPFGGVFDLATRFRIGGEIKHWAPDIVLAWMNRAAQKTPKSKAVLCGRLGGYYDLKYYRHCDHLIGNTEDIVSYIRKAGWPHERAHYLPNFVSAKRAAPIAKETLETPADAPVVVSFGRLHKNKAFDVLIGAIAMVPHAHLWLAGEGPERAALESLANDKGVSSRIRFLGWRDDIEALLASADLFVCPSRHEPLGNVVLEAFAQERPVVAAAAQGPSSLIQDGVSGRLVPIDNSAKMADAINGLLADPRARASLAAGGFAVYNDKFTQDAVTNAYMNFFAKVRR